MPKTIYLTFDDGPQEPFTSQILELLSRHNARATFFVCGKNIKQHPQAIKKMDAAGHKIGIHSYSHNLAKVLAGNLFKEFELTRRLIKESAGVDTRLGRCPWGIAMPWTSYRLAGRGYRLVNWDIMAFDWRRPSARKMAAHIMSRAFDGAVVLLHDGNGSAGGDRSQTVQAVSLLLNSLSGQGCRFAALDENIFRRPAMLKSVIADNLIWITR